MRSHVIVVSAFYDAGIWADLKPWRRVNEKKLSFLQVTGRYDLGSWRGHSSGRASSSS